jgi:TATA-binding protein-associated factor Taf7
MAETNNEKYELYNSTIKHLYEKTLAELAALIDGDTVDKSVIYNQCDIICLLNILDKITHDTALDENEAETIE